MAFVTFPNGCNLDHWWPTGEGAAFQLNKTMEPLESVKRHIQVISGLDHLNAEPGPDGAGDHARANATLLTGVRARKTAGADIHLGVSVDQVAAERDRPSHAVPVARAHLRSRAAGQGLRQRLRLRVSVQRLVAVGHHADAARAEPAAGVRAALRRRRARPARPGLHGSSADAAVDSRFRARRRPLAAAEARRPRRPASSTSISPASAKSNSGSSTPKRFGAVPDPDDRHAGRHPARSRRPHGFDVRPDGARVPDRFDADRHA